jgi:hypothetical protein
VQLQVSRPPKAINVCQCSICRRYGAAWGYYDIHEVTILSPPVDQDKQGTIQAGRDLEGVREYSWGPKTSTFNHCATCGCMLYHWPTDHEPTQEPALNMSCVENPEDLKHVDKHITYGDALA